MKNIIRKVKKLNYKYKLRMFVSFAEFFPVGVGLGRAFR